MEGFLKKQKAYAIKEWTDNLAHIKIHQKYSIKKKDKLEKYTCNSVRKIWSKRQMDKRYKQIIIEEETQRADVYIKIYMFNNTTRRGAIN